MILDLVRTFAPILDRLVPDAAERARIEAELRQADREALARILEAQRDVAMAETQVGRFWTLWRPAMSWLVIVAGALKLIVSPLLEAGFGVAIPMDDAMLQTYATWWLAIYGGGHTVKFAAEKAADALKRH